ncbi:MAG: acyl carrier protein [Chloroflexi bacterium]|nr:acyl carrier protein [Chloroflexota bacterium]
MENDNLIVHVQETVAEALQVPIRQIAPNLAFGGIKEWDSMGHMGVMMLLEERFGISIDAEIIAALTSVPAICEYIQKTRKD